jgi:AMP nucleosidase
MEPTDDPDELAYRRQYTAFVEPGNVTTWSANQEGLETPGRFRRGTGTPAADAGLSPAARRWQRHHAGQHRRRSFQCQDGHRPRGGAASAWLADAGPLRRAVGVAADGDYVLAHAYVRDDHVLDDDLPLWVPIPALAEVQLACRMRWPASPSWKAMN